MGPQSWRSEKILVHLGSRLRFSRVYSASLLFGQSGFESRTAQTLRACNFAALWSARAFSISFESPITRLLGFERLEA